MQKSEAKDNKHIYDILIKITSILNVDFEKVLGGISSLDKNIVSEIVKDYEILKEAHEIEKLYTICVEMLETQEEMELIFSFLWNCTKDRTVIDLMFKFLENDRESTSIYEMNLILFNYLQYCFLNNTKVGLEEWLWRKEKFQLIKDIILKNNDINYDLYTIYENRNKDNIVILTDQFLSESHAPTRIVQRLYNALKNIGKNVYIVVWNENNRSDEYTCNFCGSYCKNYLGDEEIIYLWNSLGIDGYYDFFQLKNKKCVKNVFEYILQINPEFVWYVGGESISYNLISMLTTCVVMSCTANYLSGDYEICVSYSKGESVSRKEIKKYLLEEGKSCLDIELIDFGITNIKQAWKRYDMKIPEEMKLIALAGNRLDMEINDEVILVLKKIIENTVDTGIVIIGDMKLYEKKFKDEVFNNKTFYLGFQKDYAAAVNMCDMIFNPPRQGGGSCAILALQLRKPIVTLEECDVSTLLPKECACINLDELSEKSIKILSDKSYYDMMVGILEKNQLEYTPWEQGIKEMVNNIEKILKETKDK